jgi:DNA recombination protein RmuC
LSAVVALALSLVSIVAVAGVGVLVVRLLRSELSGWRSDSRGDLAERSTEVDRRLQAVVETMDRRLSELDTKVDRRLETASHTTSQIHERLGKVDEATAQMLQRAKELGRLEQALRPPKARGGFGELLLANLLRDRLPSDSYALQHTFKSGERVDAVIRVERLVPVDAKFPLDNFERLVEAEEDEQRALYEKAFARDLKGHVDSIAGKYILPSENTYDFALMYLPAEAVYYELVCGKTGALLTYAHDKRVFPVSPTSFHAYLQVISLGLKGLQIEQHAAPEGLRALQGGLHARRNPPRPGTDEVRRVREAARPLRGQARAGDRAAGARAGDRATAAARARRRVATRARAAARDSTSRSTSRGKASHPGGPSEKARAGSRTR